jgi:hypothetical protein
MAAANLRGAAFSAAPVTCDYERGLRPCIAWFSPAARTIDDGGDH